MKTKVEERLDALYAGFEAMKREGFPVEAIAPQGAIYLSVRFDLFGRTINGRSIATNDDIRRLLLEAAGLALVPFQAFGLREDTGWFRLSVGRRLDGGHRRGVPAAARSDGRRALS